MGRCGTKVENLEGTPLEDWEGKLMPRTQRETACSCCLHWDEYTWTISYLSPPIMFQDQSRKKEHPFGWTWVWHSLLPVLKQQEVSSPSNFHGGAGAWHIIPQGALKSGIWQSFYNSFKFCFKLQQTNEAVIIKECKIKGRFSQAEGITMILHLVGNDPVDSHCGWKSGSESLLAWFLRVPGYFSHHLLPELYLAKLTLYSLNNSSPPPFFPSPWQPPCYFLYECEYSGYLM